MMTISQVICCLLIQENVTTRVMWMVCDLQTLKLSRYMEISHKTYMHPIHHIEYVSFKIDNWNSKYIKNVLYIPTIINNLVSVKQWMDMWCDPQCTLMSHVIHSTQCKCTTCNVLWNELSWPCSWDPNWWLLSRSIFMHKLWKRNAKSTNSFKLLSNCYSINKTRFHVMCCSSTTTIIYVWVWHLIFHPRGFYNSCGFLLPRASCSVSHYHGIHYKWRLRHFAPSFL